MYRYNKYITRHLIYSTLLITFSLTSIVWLTQALRFIDFIVNQGVSIGVFLELTALLVPSLLFMILPPALFCAVLFVYNKLRTDSELVVLQAAGLSNWRLAKPAVEVAAGLTLFIYVIAFYLQPVSQQQFRQMQNFLKNNYASILLQDGVFNTPMSGLTVFIRTRDKHNILRGILVHDNRQPEAAVTMMADEAKLVETPQGPQFLLKNGNRQEMREGRLSFLSFERYTLDISLYAKDLSDRRRSPQELFVHELFRYDDSISAEENLKRLAEGHQRLLWPLYALCLTLVAMATLFSGEFNRRGHWQRLATASVIATFLLFSAVGLRGVITSHPWLVSVAYINLMLPFAIAVYVLTDHYKSNTPTRMRA